MFESKSGVLLVAGLAFFGLAFVSNAVVPALMYRHIPEKKVAELVNGNIRYQFEDLSKRFPESFVAAFGEPPPVELPDPNDDAATKAAKAAKMKVANEWWNARCAEALWEGRKIYVGEGCWHCHSQFIRPVSNEERRWGPVSSSEEYQNELQRPVMFGTRRVGPDLSRAGGRRSNDWHAVHFFRPEDLSARSPMPEYPWFFDGAPERPNRRGLAIITYVQWLGSWLESYPTYQDYERHIEAEPKPETRQEVAAQ
jgi:hypothetical protein